MPDSPKAKKSAKKNGEVKITFFDDRTFKIDLTGIVTTGSLQRCRRSLYKAAQLNRSKLRMARKKAEVSKEE